MDPKPEFDKKKLKLKLFNKAAIITGGDSGIGRATALAFSREGCDVGIIYLNEHKDAMITKQKLESEGRECVLIPGDISDEIFCKKAVEKLYKEFGLVSPMGRAGQPEEIAPYCVFLASDDSSFIGGQVLYPYGGEILNG